MATGNAGAREVIPNSKKSNSKPLREREEREGFGEKEELRNRSRGEGLGKEEPCVPAVPSLTPYLCRPCGGRWAC